ncbi:MAG: DUF4956 domain-containing protein [Clostridia bacterium]|nr:DUF4956 domain-containing protein [Clostridia bacterium]
MPYLFESVIGTEITLETYLICIAAAIGCGILTAIAASVRSHPSKSFLTSLILLPAIVSTVITMVNGNIGTGVAVMGAFSLVRFRSVPGKAKDIVSIFLAMTSGLACAGGYVAIALVFTAIISVIMVLLSFVPYGDERVMNLEITIPESLCFADEFEDIFASYTKKHRLVRTKTSNMGSLYKLFYKVELKDRRQMQAFIDDLRCRNGNLEISISDAPEGVEEL